MQLGSLTNQQTRTWMIHAYSWTTTRRGTWIVVHKLPIRTFVIRKSCMSNFLSKNHADLMVHESPVAIFNFSCLVGMRTTLKKGNWIDVPLKTRKFMMIVHNEQVQNEKIVTNSEWKYKLLKVKMQQLWKNSSFRDKHFYFKDGYFNKNLLIKTRLFML